MKFVYNSPNVSLLRIFTLVIFFFLIKLAFFQVPLYRCLFGALFLLEISKHRYIRLKVIDLFFISNMLLLVCLSVFRSVLTNDFTIAFYMFESILNLFAAVVIYNLFYHDKPFDLLIREVVYAILFQSLLMLLMLVSSPIKFFFNSIFPSSVPLDKWSWRHIGLTGFAAYNMGIFLALGMLLCIFLFINNFFNIRKTLIICSCFLITSLLSARSSFIVLFFIFIYLVLHIKKKKVMLFLFIVISLFLLLFFLLYQYSLVNEKFKFIFDWVFSIFLTIFAKGKSFFDVEGFAVIGENFYWLPDFFTFTFGDGLYSNPTGTGYYMGTDAGYMRRLLFFGIFASVFFYVIYMYYFYINIKNIKSFDIRVILAVILCTIFIMQYKGDFFIDAGETFRLSFLLIVASREEFKHKPVFCVVSTK